MYVCVRVCWLLKFKGKFCGRKKWYTLTQNDSEEETCLLFSWLEERVGNLEPSRTIVKKLCNCILRFYLFPSIVLSTVDFIILPRKDAFIATIRRNTFFLIAGRRNLFPYKYAKLHTVQNVQHKSEEETRNRTMTTTRAATRQQSEKFNQENNQDWLLAKEMQCQLGMKHTHVNRSTANGFNVPHDTFTTATHRFSCCLRCVHTQPFFLMSHFQLWNGVFVFSLFLFFSARFNFISVFIVSYVFFIVRYLQAILYESG